MPQQLQFAITNQASAGQGPVYAYVTGIYIPDGRRCLLRADGHNLYFPTEPSCIGSPLLEDCAIPLGDQGNTTSIVVPQLAGGRLWFSHGQKLTFVLNPGPALVEPSVLNPSDPNAHVDFAFCEFTLNDAQFYANISFVDFVPRLPIALQLDTASGQSQHVAGLPRDGLIQISNGLRQQANIDKRPWDKLIVGPADNPLRALNPTHGDAVQASFAGYYEPYVDQVWCLYGSSSFSVNTQAAAGTLQASIDKTSGQLCVGKELFTKPNTADIFGCNSGPFTTGPSPDRNAIIPRLAAAFIRSTLLDTQAQPSSPDTFYKGQITSHYARILHQVTCDHKGYAFAYDDVQVDGGEDQSGKVNAGDPTVFRVTIGGA